MWSLWNSNATALLVIGSSALLAVSFIFCLYQFILLNFTLLAARNQ